MIRGTTPTLTFNTDVDLTGADRLYITFQQNGKTVLEKSLEDMTVTPTTITLTLTQADTLAFENSRNAPEVLIQIRAGWLAGDAIASDIMYTTVNRLLKDGVI